MRMDPNDLHACTEAIRHGSLSFHAASHLLPRDVREPALALYAFCRLADDAVDLQKEKAAAVLSLGERLEMVYRGQPRNAPPDRAFACVVEAFDMPRELPEALLEGLAWDATARRYETISDLRGYGARVASAVGAMMCVLMRVRDPDALARACDLGVAMQLTNIARDIGEDAWENRLYIPLEWMDSAGIDPEKFLSNPRPTKAIRQMTRKLIMESNRLYFRSEAGIRKLPIRCRPGILAARHIYAGIGSTVQSQDFDTISSRARTSKPQKIGWLIRSLTQSLTMSVMPQSAVLYAAPLDEVAFLVRAAARQETTMKPRDPSLVSTLAHLAARDRAKRAALIDTRYSST